MSEVPIKRVHTQADVQYFLAGATAIRGACELDLLVFLYRHPYTLLTNEQLATYVGYETKRIAKAIETFIEIDLLERTQNPTHTARMYRLLLGESGTGGYKALLELAGTRQGRHSILQALNAEPSNPARGRSASSRKLRVIA